MNIENLNLVELNAQEVNCIDGGTIPIGPVVNTLGVFTFCAQSVYNSVHIGAGMVNGFLDGLQGK
jgi:hypothetical protein